MMFFINKTFRLKKKSFPCGINATTKKMKIKTGGD